MRIAPLLLVSVIALAGCESMAHKVTGLQVRYRRSRAGIRTSCAGGVCPIAQRLKIPDYTV
jgi:hypothetical protein